MVVVNKEGRRGDYWMMPLTSGKGGGNDREQKEKTVVKNGRDAAKGKERRKEREALSSSLLVVVVVRRRATREPGLVKLFHESRRFSCKESVWSYGAALKDLMPR